MKFDRDHITTGLIEEIAMNVWWRTRGYQLVLKDDCTVTKDDMQMATEGDPNEDYWKLTESQRAVFIGIALHTTAITLQMTARDLAGLLFPDAHTEF